jgi:predicted transcriptional regulator
MRRRLEVSAAEIAKLYEQSFSIYEVARKLGISASVVTRRLKESGVPRRGPKTIDQHRTEKQCHFCKVLQPAANFNRCRSRTDGRSATCKTCWAGYQSEKQLLSKYGITGQQYRELLAAQGYGCAICSSTDGMLRLGRKLRLNVDHCHVTGKVRGILCNSCNNGLGRFRDNPDLLLKAADYLQQAR